MEAAKKTRKRRIALISLFVLMLCIQIIVMIGYGMRKGGFDIDEYWTYGLSNSYGKPFLTVEPGKWQSGALFREYLTVGNHGHEYLNVYNNQIADVHPPLYYLCMHALCSTFFRGFTKWAGIVLNLFWFAAAQGMLFALGCMTLGSKGENGAWDASALFPPLLYGFSAGAVSGVVFIRMYAMMTFWAAALAVVLVMLWQRGQSAARLFALRAVLVCGFLTQYYFVIYASLLSLVYFISCLLGRDGQGAWRFVLSCFAALALAIGFFPWSVAHIFAGYRGKAAFESVAGLNPNDWLRWVRIMLNQLSWQQFGGWLYALLVVLAGGMLTASVFGRGGVKPQTFCGAAVLAVCSGYIAVIALVAPYKVDRYIFCVYPLVMFALYLLLMRLMEQWGIRHTAALVLSGAVLIAAGANVDRTQQIHYLFPEHAAYLAQCEANSALPCVVLGASDMTQNVQELGAFRSVCVLEKQESAKIGAMLALNDTYDSSLGFVLFQRRPDPQAVRQIAAEMNAEEATLLFSHQYDVYRIR